MTTITKYQQRKAKNLETTENSDSFSLSLSVSIAKIITACGFKYADSASISTLNEIAQKVLYSLSRKTQSLAEIGQRSEITDKDAMLAVVQENINIKSIISYSQIYKNTNVSKTTKHLPQPSTYPNIKENLSIGPKKKIGVIGHAENVPTLPDLFTFKNTNCFIHHEESFEKIRDKQATSKVQSQYNLASFIARSEYCKNPNVNAFAVFKGEEILSSQEPVNKKIKLNGVDIPLEDSDQKIDFTSSWGVLPIILDTQVQSNDSYSSYVTALLPSKNETDLLLSNDPFLLKKKPLRPKKEIKKSDRRSKGTHGKNKTVAQYKSEQEENSINNMTL